jgi:hypothetical protein
LGSPDEGEAEDTAIWSVIENGSADQQEEMMALDALCGVIPPEMVPTIVKKEMSKEAWDTIVIMRIGDDCVKKATSQQRRRKFDLATFDDGEIVEDYALRLSGMIVSVDQLDEIGYKIDIDTGMMKVREPGGVLLAKVNWEANRLYLLHLKFV